MEDQKLVAVLTEGRDTNINLCLSAAQALLDSEEYANAERLFNRGLVRSEERFGAQSAAVGLVLMSIIEIYENDGQNRSPELLERRVRDILRRYFFRSLVNR
jgi:hypothetical protein